MGFEAEMPGIEITREQLQIICNRYYFAGQYLSGKVLEVGCGAGLGLGYLSQKAEVIGGDITQENINYAKAHYKGRIELMIMDAHHLPFKNNTFDVVVAMAVTIYLKLDNFLKECSRVLKPRGLLIFCIPNLNVSGFQPSRLSRNYYSVPDLYAMVSRWFDTEMFGVFKYQQSNLRNKLVAIASKTIKYMMGDRVRQSLSHSVLHTLKLPPEIKEGMANYIQPTPIQTNMLDVKHKVIYVVGRKK
jgi:SAM-dependent methyltransferase